MTAKAEQKTFATPDETRTFERGTLDLLQIGGAEMAGSPCSPDGAGPTTSSHWQAPNCARRRISSTTWRAPCTS